MAHRPSSRCAYIAVNFSGMCCTMAMPGLSAGSASRTCSMACVPPVELPITTGLLTDSACRPWQRRASGGHAWLAAALPAARERGCDRAASFSAWDQFTARVLEELLEAQPRLGHDGHRARGQRLQRDSGCHP
jgi:hypothetical protein